MAACNDLIDRFVRWFFNSSPTAMAIEPRVQVPVHRVLLHHGFVGGVGVAAIVVLMVFYSVVAGAVDRAAERRAATQTVASLSGHR
jgi:hypothetical protein